MEQFFTVDQVYNLMELDNPRTWKCPSDWHPDTDGIWEISCLRTLALVIQERVNNHKVLINIEDPTCVYFSVIGSDKKIGEVYVNRKKANSDIPLFSLFYGEGEEEELHSPSLDECASKLASSVQVDSQF